MAPWVKEQPGSIPQNRVKVEGETWLTKLFSDFPQTRCDISSPPTHKHTHAHTNINVTFFNVFQPSSLITLDMLMIITNETSLTESDIFSLEIALC